MAVQKMHVIVQKKQVAFVDNGPQHQTGRAADVGAAQTHKANRAAAMAKMTQCDFIKIAEVLTETRGEGEES